MKKPFLILSLFILTLNGCEQFANKKIEKLTTGNCIAPIVDFSFPVNQEINITSKPIVAPKSPWEIDRILPQWLDGFSSQDNIIFIRQLADKSSEIWIMSYTHSVSQQTSSEKNIASIVSYNIEDKSWTRIPTPDPHTDTMQRVDRLYLSKNGQIYAVDLSLNVISKFDESKKQFQALKVPSKLPIGSIIFDEARELFWIFAPRQAIYKFNPETLQLEKYTETPNVDITFENGIAIASDGSLYIINDKGKDVLRKSDLEILHFMPEKNTLELVHNPLLDQTPYFSLFIDYSGSLWLDDHAWRSSTGIWHQIIRSPLFITDRMPDSGYNYLWLFPKIIFESSDGLLWFQSENGLTWLNRQKGEWCWFTTYKSNIVEDSDHNLWMIADGKLYKNPLGK